MARPQAEDGFVMVACDLFAAIGAAGFRDYELVVLSEVLLQQYGPQKRREATVTPADLMASTGVDHRNLRRAIKALVGAGVLEPIGEDGVQFRFIKDYESWTLSPDRLGDRMRFVRTARTRFMKPKTDADKSGSNGTLSEPSKGSIQTPEGSIQTPLGPSKGSIQTPLGPSKGSIQTPNGSGAVGGKGGSCTPGAPASEDLRPSDLRPSDPTPQSAGGGADEAEIRRVAEKIDRAAEHLHWAPKVRTFAAMGYPPWWIEEAAELALAKGKPWEFVHGILRRFEREGRTKERPSPVPAGPAASPSAPAPSRSQQRAAAVKASLRNFDWEGKNGAR